MLLQRYPHYWIIFTWGLVGLGLGLMVLSMLLWLRQTGVSDHDNIARTASAQLVAPLKQLRAGQLPVADTVDQPQWAPLWTAFAVLQRQRSDALTVYQVEISQAAITAWLTPRQLVQPKGRAELTNRLTKHDKALRDWVQREAKIRSEFDDAFQLWLAQAPKWLPESAKQAFFDISAESASVLDEYVQLEQSLLIQIKHLVEHVASLGAHVSLVSLSVQTSASNDQAHELIFDKTIDLNRYQSSVLRLSDLAEQEQTQMALIKQMDHTHIKRLTQTIDSVIGGAASDL